MAGLVLAQEEEPVPPEAASPPPIAITFTPPDLAGAIVLGIFDAAGKLVRTLRFSPGAPELKVDTNGYIASWDGRDEAGAACAGGRYSARGYVVGDKLDVAGEAFHFNDWMAEDQIPATGASLGRWPDALGVELTTAAGGVRGKIRADGTFERTDEPPISAAMESAAWIIVEDAGQKVVVQLGKEQQSKRELRVPKDEPQPRAVLAASGNDEILLLEGEPGGVERVRLLKRGTRTEEKDGKVVADWEVLFERTWQPCAKFGVLDGKLAADAGDAVISDRVEVSLVENALEPGKKESLPLVAMPTHPGSALAAPGGLRLVEVSARGEWNRLALVSVAGSDARLYQGDGVVVEEFSLAGLDQIAAFDAGTFLLAAPPQ